MAEEIGRIWPSLALILSSLLSVLDSLMSKRPGYFIPLLMPNPSVWNGTLSPLREPLLFLADIFSSPGKPCLLSEAFYLSEGTPILLKSKGGFQADTGRTLRHSRVREKQNTIVLSAFATRL